MDYFNLLPDDLINKIRMINICEEIETINTDRGVGYWIEDLPREGYLFDQIREPDWVPHLYHGIEVSDCV